MLKKCEKVVRALNDSSLDELCAAVEGLSAGTLTVRAIDGGVEVTEVREDVKVKKEEGHGGGREEDDEAEEKAVRDVMRLFREWERANADEVIDIGMKMRCIDRLAGLHVRHGYPIVARLVAAMSDYGNLLLLCDRMIERETMGERLHTNDVTEIVGEMYSPGRGKYESFRFDGDWEDLGRYVDHVVATYSGDWRFVVQLLKVNVPYRVRRECAILEPISGEPAETVRWRNALQRIITQHKMDEKRGYDGRGGYRGGGRGGGRGGYRGGYRGGGRGGGRGGRGQGYDRGYGGRGTYPPKPDWECPKCGANVFGWRSQCYKCGAERPKQDNDDKDQGNA